LGALASRSRLPHALAFCSLKVGENFSAATTHGIAIKTGDVRHEYLAAVPQAKGFETCHPSTLPLVQVLQEYAQLVVVGVDSIVGSTLADGARAGGAEAHRTRMTIPHQKGN